MLNLSIILIILNQVKYNLVIKYQILRLYYLPKKLENIKILYLRPY